MCCPVQPTRDLTLEPVLGLESVGKRLMVWLLPEASLAKPDGETLSHPEVGHPEVGPPLAGGTLSDRYKEG